MAGNTGIHACSTHSPGMRPGILAESLHCLAISARKRSLLVNCMSQLIDNVRRGFFYTYRNRDFNCTSERVPSKNWFRKSEGCNSALGEQVRVVPRQLGI